MNTFCIHPLGEDNYVEITFNVLIKSETYHINFTYNFSEQINTKYKRKSILKNLDLYDNELEEYYKGDIIAKNSLTDELVSYMLMNDKDLELKSGHVHSESYRLSLIKTIKLLWD
jgi:hypothetical protein